MEYKDIVKNNGGTLYTTIPKKLADSMELKDNDFIIVTIKKITEETK